MKGNGKDRERKAIKVQLQQGGRLIIPGEEMGEKKVNEKKKSRDFGSFTRLLNLFLQLRLRCHDCLL